MIIRAETPGDSAAIHALTAAAFHRLPLREVTEPYIVDALRVASALTISLVVEDQGEIVGHVAFSPANIDGQAGRWYALGPVSVAPARQRQGVGTQLIETGLSQLRDLISNACLVITGIHPTVSS